MDHAVERGITGPGPEHPMIELQPVHLGPDELPIDALWNRPALRIDGGQALLKLCEGAALFLHRRGAVVWNPVRHLRLLDVAPLAEQGDEVLVAAGGGCDARRAGHGLRNREERRDRDRGPGLLSQGEPPSWEPVACHASQLRAPRRARLHADRARGGPRPRGTRRWPRCRSAPRLRPPSPEARRHPGMPPRSEVRSHWPSVRLRPARGSPRSTTGTPAR